jgi:hypothetical protein
MTDGLLTGQDRQEALSRAFIQAIAAGAGYVVATMDFDRNGVDVEIKAGGAMRPSLALQLKATVNLGEAIDGAYRFPLKRRNYDWLREQTQIPRLLAVLDLPRTEVEWLQVTPDKLNNAATHVLGLLGPTAGDEQSRERYDIDPQYPAA